MDYYNILGVSKNASEQQLKLAYRKLAMTYHPDRTGGDDTKFKQINEAYNTLKDPATRQQYDNPQPQQFHYNTGNMPNNLNDMFENIFRQRHEQHIRNKDLKVAITIKLEDVLTNKDIIIDYNLLNGQQTTATIRINAGVQHGETIRFKGLGDNSRQGLHRGDLIVLVKIARHSIFERDGRHLRLTQEVSILDLILGTKVNIKTLTGNTVSVNIPKATQSGTILSISNNGLPDPKTGLTGHLYLTIKGITPKIEDLNIIEQVQKIKDAINNRTP
jgi:DnaJ-class molecular chaperone